MWSLRIFDARHISRYDIDTPIKESDEPEVKIDPIEDDEELTIRPIGLISGQMVMYIYMSQYET